MIGIIGMTCILLAFVMVQMHRWTPDDLRYDLFNFVGSTLLVINALSARVWPFVILNMIWGLYALRDVIFVDRWEWKTKQTRRG